MNILRPSLFLSKGGISFLHCLLEMESEASVPTITIVQLRMTSCPVRQAQETMSAFCPLAGKKGREHLPGTTAILLDLYYMCELYFLIWIWCVEFRIKAHRYVCWNIPIIYIFLKKTTLGCLGGSIC